MCACGINGLFKGMVHHLIGLMIVCVSTLRQCSLLENSKGTHLVLMYADARSWHYLVKFSPDYTASS